MPLYEYRCQKCGEEYEKREGFDAPARQRCPTCRGAALRVFHAPPIVFKGSGFYVTDNRGSNPAAEPAAEPAAKTEKKADSTTTSDTPSSKDVEPAAAG